MWEAFKQGYYGAGGPDVVSLFGIIMGNVFKGMCWGVGFGIALHLMGVL